MPPALVTNGGTRATISWSSAARQFRQSTLDPSSRGVCGAQRQRERSAINLLFSPRAVAPSQLTVDCDSAPSHSAHRFPCHSVHRARPGQIPRIELARFTRVVSRCAACGRRERLEVRCHAARIFNKSAVLEVGWRDSARMVGHPEVDPKTFWALG